MPGGYAYEDDNTPRPPVSAYDWDTDVVMTPNQLDGQQMPEAPPVIYQEPPDLTPSGNYGYEPDSQTHQDYDFDDGQLNPFGPQDEHEVKYEEPDMAPSGNYAYEPDSQTHDSYDYDTNELNPFGPGGEQAQQEDTPENTYDGQEMGW